MIVVEGATVFFVVENLNELNEKNLRTFFDDIDPCEREGCCGFDFFCIILSQIRQKWMFFQDKLR